VIDPEWVSKMTKSLPIIKNEIYRGLSKLVVALLLDFTLAIDALPIVILKILL
jgi:hypothetical protein